MINKLYIIGGIFGLGIALLVGFFIWPLISDIKHNSQNLLSIKNNTAALEVQNNQIERFKKIYPEYQPNLTNMEQSFVDLENPIDAITFLEDTARDLGIDAKISLVPRGSNKNQTMITFQVFSSDDFLKIMDFCQKLENSSYATTIESISIDQAPGVSEAKNSTSGKVDATLLIHFFKK